MRALLPSLQSSCITKIQSSLKLLVLSGEILHVSLWETLTKLLPNTRILNLYGSTEVSGDCTYFDCKRLSSILETEVLNTVPIGIPIPDCEVVLVGEDAPNHGEIYVSGHCVAMGYFNNDIMPLNAVNLLPGSTFCHFNDEKESPQYFKTGDFAKKLSGGDLVFLGRNDRTVKINGQRIALEEIENTIRAHDDVANAAVIFEDANLEAYIVTKEGHHHVKDLRSFRGWMVDKLPLAMIPSHLFFIESIPMSSSGKVNYTLLASLRCSMSDVCTEVEKVPDSGLLQGVKKAFCDALVVDYVGNNDDFFAMGGNSISAAHASHKLGINMRLLYTFPTPLKLVMALLEPELHNRDVKLSDLKTNKPHSRLLSKLNESIDVYQRNKVLKMNSDINVDSVNSPWDFISEQTSCAFSRCNKVIFGEKNDNNRLLTCGTTRQKHASIKKLWKVHMESCVDASPLIVVRERDIYVYIGSHSHKFLCIKAQSC